MKSFTTLTGASALLISLSSLATACSTVGNHQVTFYGWPDNDPASAQTAYNCGGRNNVAGGTGTYADPLTFATAPGEYNQCEILYLPLLKKYIRMEDSCAQCTSDFGSGKKHIDIWTGSNTGSGGQAQIDCENDLTTGGQYGIVRQPPQGLEVDSTPLFANGKCNKQAVFESNQASCDGGSAAASSGNATESSTGSAKGSKPTGSATGSAKGSKSTASGDDDNDSTSTGSGGDDEGSSSSGSAGGNGGYGSTPTTFQTKTTAAATSAKKHKEHKAHSTKSAAASTCTDE